MQYSKNIQCLRQRTEIFQFISFSLPEAPIIHKTHIGVESKTKNIIYGTIQHVLFPTIESKMNALNYVLSHTKK
jgi:hypothetical protein